jgi:hypothetical protein
MSLVIRFLSLILEIERRERRPVADRQLLKDVIKMHFNRTVRNFQSASNLLVR